MDKGKLSKLLEVFNVCDNYQSNALSVMETLRAQCKWEKAPLSSNFAVRDGLLSMVGDELVKHPMTWGLCSAYVMLQYLLHEIDANFLEDPQHTQGTQDMFVGIVAIVTRLVSGTPGDQLIWNDASMVRASNLHANPMHQIMYDSCFSTAGPGQLFDDKNGEVDTDEVIQPTNDGVDQKGLKTALNLGLCVLAVVKMIKKNCAGPSRDGHCKMSGELLRTLLSKMALALTLSMRVDSNVDKVLQQTMASIVMIGDNKIYWIGEKSLDDIAGQNNIEQMNCTQLFYNTVVKLRFAFRLYGESCSALTDVNRKVLNKIADKAVQISTDEASTILNMGTDTSHIKLFNRKLLLASSINVHYITKIFMSLSWVAQIFSIDNLPKLFAMGNPEEVDLLLARWLDIFFVEYTFDKVLKNNLVSVHASIDAEVAADTNYVKQIMKQATSRKYISRFHLQKRIVQMIENINATGSDDAFIQAAKYNVDFVKKFQDFCSRSSGVLKFREMESHAVDSKNSSSRSAVLSFVRIRALNNMYMARHRFLAHPGQAHKKFYVQYSSDYTSALNKRPQLKDMRQQLVKNLDGELEKSPEQARADDLARREEAGRKLDEQWREREEARRKADVFQREEDDAQAARVRREQEARMREKIPTAARAEAEKTSSSSSSSATARTRMPPPSSSSLLARARGSPAAQKDAPIGKGRQKGGSEEAAALAYDQVYAFGPFTRIFYPNHTNDQIGDSTYEVLHHLQNRKSVMVMGFGISGAGKTSTLIYLRPKGGTPVEGVVLRWLRTLADQNYFTDGISYCAVELYANDVKYDPSQVTGRSSEKLQNMKKPINERTEDDNIYTDGSFTLPSMEGLKKQHWTTLQRGRKDLITQLAEDVVTRIEHPAFRQTKPTPNNESSSRSHVVVTFKISKKTTDADSESSFLHIVDLAGVENRFDHRSEVALAQFKDYTKQSCESFGYKNALQELNMIRQTESDKREANGDSVACSCIERYIFNDNHLFIANKAGENKNGVLIEPIGEEVDKLTYMNKATDINVMNPSNFQTGTDKVQGPKLRAWYMAKPQPLGVKVNINKLTYAKGTQYKSSQLWASVAVNPFAALAYDDKKKKVMIRVPFTACKMSAMIGRAKAALSDGEATCLFPKALAAIETRKMLCQNARKKLNDTSTPFGELVWQNRQKQHVETKDSPVLNSERTWSEILPFLKPEGFGNNAKWRVSGFQLQTGVRGLKDPHKGKLLVDNFSKMATKSAPETILSENIGKVDLYKAYDLPTARLLPDFTPPLLSLDKPKDFNNLSILSIEKLKGIKTSILHAANPSDVTPLSVARSMLDALTLFNGVPNPAESDAEWNMLFTLPQREVIVAKTLEAAFDGNFAENLRSLIRFFESTNKDLENPQQRLYAYIQMMYAYIGDGLALNRVNTLNTYADASNQVEDAYKTEFCLRSSIPLAMFILRKDVKTDAYMRSMYSDSGEWELVDKIYNIEVASDADSVRIESYTEGGKIMETQQYHTCPVSIRDGSNIYDMGLAEHFKREDGGSQGVECMHLPISSSGPPMIWMDAAEDEPARMKIRASDLSFMQLTRIVKFIEQCYSIKTTDPKAVPLHPAMWIRWIFLFIQSIAGIDELAKAKQECFDDHIRYYMLQRTGEGTFINKSVYALRDTLYGIVDLQNSANSYGNPGFLSECSFYGCHPFLDGECFRQPGGTAKADRVLNMDPLMKYVMQYQAVMKLKLSVMVAINLSSNVLDPPAVPYISYTKLLHAYRLWSFTHSGSDQQGIMQQYVDPASEEGDNKLELSLRGPVRPSNPVGLDILGKKEMEDLINEALRDVKLEIEKALPMSASLLEVRSKIIQVLGLSKAGTSESGFQIKQLEDILDAIKYHNNASLIGNLAFVDSLQKRGAESICDITHRQHGSKLYSIEIPQLCGKTDGALELSKMTNVNIESYSVENIRGSLAEVEELELARRSKY